MKNDCEECKRLLSEYDHTRSKQIQVENKLLSAASEHDSDSIRALQPEVYEAWKRRAAARDAVRAHRALHLSVLAAVVPRSLPVPKSS